MPPFVLVSELLKAGIPLVPGEAAAVAMTLGELAVWRGGREGSLAAFDSVGFDQAGRLVVRREESQVGHPVAGLLAFLTLATRGGTGVRMLETLLESQRGATAMPLDRFLHRLSAHAPFERRVVLASLVARMQEHLNRNGGQRPAMPAASGHAGSPPRARASSMAAPLTTRLALTGLIAMAVLLTWWTGEVWRHAESDVHGRAQGASRAVSTEPLVPAAVSAAERDSLPQAFAARSGGAGLARPETVFGVSTPWPDVRSEPSDGRAAAAGSGVPSPPARAGLHLRSGARVRREVLPPPGGGAVEDTRESPKEGPTRPREGVSTTTTPNLTPGVMTSAILWARPSAHALAAPSSSASNRQGRTPIYSGTRSGVVPARLLRFPDDAAPSSHEHPVGGTVELVVDEQGAVEQVKLVAQGEYSEIQRMARAWRRARFAPATLAGRVVRYRISLPLWPSN